MPLSTTVADTIQHWGSVTFTEKEVPFGDLVETVRGSDGRFVLKKSKQYSNSLVLWDNEIKDIATITYAYIVRYASPILTGNFVPEGKPLPDGMMDYLRKSEPSNMAQISVTFDVRMDDGLLEMITSLEEWISTQSEFDPGQRPRNPWMSPTYIANNMKFTVTSQLFQSKNAFNCKDGAYKVDYPVHSWIAENCVSKNPLWIPNPNVVQFYNLRDMVLHRMSESSEPELHAGDVVKMSSKLIVYSGRDTWNASFVPWQMIRVGKLDKVDIGPSIQMDDGRPRHLPKAGEAISVVIKRPRQSEVGTVKERSVSPYEEAQRRLGSSNSGLSDLSQELSDTGEGGGHTDNDFIDDETREKQAKQRKFEKIEKAETVGKRKAEDELEVKKRILKPRSTRGIH
ncbi:hypothetical protein NMY22_g894 [Coprinellus aureogranulatus]|nr:hypothetical protein NMY22_g894 [Coprinellus aureogranulatus]